MSGNTVERGYSSYLRQEVQLNGASLQTALGNASTADSKAVDAQADATQALADASTADAKAVSASSKAGDVNTGRNRDIEALLQSLVVEIAPPAGAFILGDDAGYYAWDSGSSEYRVSAYASGEALDEADAGSNATQFEFIDMGDKLYLMLQDDAGTLYIVNHNTGSREAIDDVIDGTGNDRASASTNGFESAKNPFHYLVRYCYAPANLSHIQNGNDIYSVHIRGAEDNVWLYKDTGANDRLTASAMSNVEERRLYVHDM
jgi:hypothetical protein